jgi:hypothetical protein
MTPQEKEYVGLSDDHEVTRGQIRQIEGEYDYLLAQINDSYAQDLAKVAKGVLDDPKAQKIIPSDLASGLNDSIREVEEDFELDRDQLVNQAKTMNRELKTLHSNQVKNFKEMTFLVQNYEIGDLGEDVFLKAKLEDAVEDSQESYFDMIKLLDVHYEALNNTE